MLASTDGAGWIVEAVDLWLADRQRDERRVSSEPLGDGPLLVRRYRYVIAWCADAAGLAGLGVEVSRMAVVRRW